VVRLEGLEPTTRGLRIRCEVETAQGLTASELQNRQRGEAEIGQFGGASADPGLAEVKGVWRSLSATARAAVLEVVRLDLNGRRAADAMVAREAWRQVRRQRRPVGRAAL